MAEMKPMLGDKTLALDDVKNKEDAGVSIDGLVSYINERYTRSEESKYMIVNDDGVIKIKFVLRKVY